MYLTENFVEKFYITPYTELWLSVKVFTEIVEIVAPVKEVLFKSSLNVFDSNFIKQRLNKQNINLNMMSLIHRHYILHMQLALDN